MHIRSCYGLSEGSITISLLFLLFSTTEPRGFIFFTLIHQEKEYSTFLSDIRADNVSVRVCVYLCSVVRLISMFVDVYLCGDLFSETCFVIKADFQKWIAEIVFVHLQRNLLYNSLLPRHFHDDRSVWMFNRSLEYFLF